MRQLVQSVRSGELRVVDAPDPLVGPTEVLVATTHSVVSAGTEKAVRALASANLLQKARARPDLVRQILRKARAEGLRSTYSAVQTRLDEDMPLGYSGSGVVLTVGEHVSGVRPGMRVATGGAGHGDLQVVAGNLAVPIPDGVSNADASFATVASIALHGLRLAEVGPGAKVCVIGLGLIGQLTARLALASGIEVVGVDLRQWTVETAKGSGAFGLVERGDDTTRAILDWSRGRGVDAILLTAATASSEPVRRAASIARDRANVVVVGDVGLELERTPLYEKEMTVRVARSYGPGRYERSYEDWAVDYPVGHVRWTEGRNIEAVLDLIASGRLKVDDIVTHRYTYENVMRAYEMLSKGQVPFLGIQIEYPETRRPRTSTASVAIPPDANAYRIGLLGAGNFTRMVLVPSITESGLGTIVAVASAGGTSAAKLADQIGAQALAPDALIDDPEIDIIVVATSHSSHAELTRRSLLAGKHVFCEKPLAITESQLDDVVDAWEQSGRQLAVGFNRRYSAAVRKAIEHLSKSMSPIVITYRVNAGALPSNHWYKDRREGGRLIGEMCHFVDTCCALVGRPVERTVALGSGGETTLAEDIVVSACFSDGSIATITYATNGSPNTPKEEITILGRGHTIVINDFMSIEVDGKDVRLSGADKGHTGQLADWSQRIRTGDRIATLEHIHSMQTTLDAAASLAGFGPQPDVWTARQPLDEMEQTEVDKRGRET